MRGSKIEKRTKKKCAKSCTKLVQQNARFTLVIQFNTQDNRNENIKLINLIF